MQASDTSPKAIARKNKRKYSTIKLKSVGVSFHPLRPGAHYLSYTIRGAEDTKHKRFTIYTVNLEIKGLCADADSDMEKREDIRKNIQSIFNHIVEIAIKNDMIDKKDVYEYLSMQLIKKDKGAIPGLDISSPYAILVLWALDCASLSPRPIMAVFKNGIEHAAQSILDALVLCKAYEKKAPSFKPPPTIDYLVNLIVRIRPTWDKKKIQAAIAKRSGVAPEALQAPSLTFAPLLGLELLADIATRIINQEWAIPVDNILIGDGEDISSYEN